MAILSAPFLVPVTFKAYVHATPAPGESKNKLVHSILVSVSVGVVELVCVKITVEFLNNSNFIVVAANGEIEHSAK